MTKGLCFVLGVGRCLHPVPEQQFFPLRSPDFYYSQLCRLFLKATQQKVTEIFYNDAGFLSAKALWVKPLNWIVVMCFCGVPSCSHCSNPFYLLLAVSRFMF